MKFMQRVMTIAITLFIFSYRVDYDLSIKSFYRAVDLNKDLCYLLIPFLFKV